MRPATPVDRRLLLTWPMVPAVALSIAAVLFFAAGTPRAKSNILHASALVFCLIVAWRARTDDRAGSSGLGSPREVLVPLGIAVLTWSGTVFHYFVADEFVHFFLARQNLTDFLRTVLLEGESGTFLRPAGFLTFWIDSRVWGNWIPGYHITNLILHLGVVAGVYALCRAAAVLRPLALPSSLVFALLPVHAEAVAWVGARFDLLSALSVVWSVYCYLRFRRELSVAWGIAALLLALLAFFSKENAYVLPALVLLAEFLLLPKRRLKTVLPFVALLVCTLAWRFAVLGGLAGYAAESGGLAETDIGLKTFEGLLVRAPSITLLGLNWLQPGGAIWLASATAGLLVVLAVRARADRRLLAFAAGWLLLAALPAHPLLLIGPALTNSRVLYLGGIGMAIVIGALLTDLGATRGFIFGIPLLTCMFLGAWHNTAAWRYAADLSRQFANELRREAPDPPPGTRFVFHGVPETIRGVYFMRVSIAEPVRLALGREDLSGDRAESFAGGAEPVIHFEWIGDPEELIRRR